MQRLIDAIALMVAVEGNPLTTESLKEYVRCTVREQPTIEDAVLLDGSFLKMSRDNYLIYNRHWFYEHFDQEIDIQRSAMKSMGYEPALKDAEPVCHAKWIESDEYDEFSGRLYRCSNCNTFVIGDMDNYCPYCGARMDKE